MKLKYNFIVNQVADKKVAVAVGDDLQEFNAFIKMNDTGAEIFEILKNDVSIEEIIEIMQTKYPEETKETVTEVVTGFVNKLKESDTIIE